MAADEHLSPRQFPTAPLEGRVVGSWDGPQPDHDALRYAGTGYQGYGPGEYAAKQGMIKARGKIRGHAIQHLLAEHDRNTRALGA